MPKNSASRSKSSRKRISIASPCLIHRSSDRDDHRGDFVPRQGHEGKDKDITQRRKDAKAQRGNKKGHT
jgi:hypothetical protein